MTALRFNKLSAWLNWLEQLHPQAIDLELTRVGIVAASLQLNHFDCPVITVAGTNGKGSCVAMLDTILRAAGYRTATYTSPHLFRYNERVCIDGQPVSDEALCTAFGVIDQARKDISLTYFEFGTLAALWLFKQQKLDALILEVGLGGRLDAVNVVENDIAMIATIDLDHCDWLGKDREMIGKEKAGIFRANKIAICGEPQIPFSVVEYAQQIGAHLLVQGKNFAYQEMSENWEWQSDTQHYKHLLKPSLNLQNAATVLMAVQVLQPRLPVTFAAINAGLQQVHLPGRFQMLPGEITYIFDVAHNPQSIYLLAQRLKQLSATGRNIAVFSMLKDKDISASLASIIEEIDSWHVAPLPVPRSSETRELINFLVELGVQSCDAHNTIAEALAAANKKAQAGDNIIVFGSFYTVAAAMINFPDFYK